MIPQRYALSSFLTVFKKKKKKETNVCTLLVNANIYIYIYIFERMVNANICLNLIREFNTWHLS